MAAPNSKKLIIVLHMIYPTPNSTDNDCLQHTLDQAHLAIGNGADGVAVIAGTGALEPELLNRAAELIRQAYPNTFIVINYLTHCPTAMQLVPPFVNGLWTDRGVDACGTSPSSTAAHQLRLAERVDWQGLWFAGYFHKGGSLRLPETAEELQALADQAVELCEVPTTTGAGTGIPANLAHLARLHEALQGRRPLAIASGIDVDNVRDYKPYIDYFFVGTGVERLSQDPAVQEFYRSAGLPVKSSVDVGYLDVARVSALAQAIHE
eukprot:TRINITY_DN875_c0_g2_i1.p1 TRINITY_DN875_c0_g2~~TRINITY_DN875_c0_g2_i1.p1  ORF type:complete len:265 (+),score=59.82 TRINITY_DN875_c0_g2_i1:77-871(+)